MTPLVLGVFAVFAGVAIALLLGFSSPKAQESASLAEWTRQATERADAAVRSRNAGFVEKLDLAGWKQSAGTVVLGAILAAAAAAVLGLIMALASPSLLSWLLILLLPAFTLLIGRVLLDRRIEQRRTAFAEQLEGTLQLIASGLRAGHSLQRSLVSVSQDSSSPTAEEFARVVNEHRLGRDIGDAMLATAGRMKSEDLTWTAQAFAIHREVGGNLSEVLDHIADTIRERQQIRRQVSTLSSEGRMSAVVLMVLPVAIALILTVISPNYLSTFFTSAIGLLMLLVSLVLFAVGGLWLRSIVRIKF